MPLDHAEPASPSRLYAFQFYGVCLGEWLPNGAELIVDPDLEIRPRDVVAVILKRDGGRWAELMNAVGDGFHGVCKFFMGTYEAPAGRVCIVGQLTPPCVALMPVTAIEAMHRVVGAPGCTELTANDQAAFELIRPFGNDASSPPINPTWPDEMEFAA